MQALEIKPLRGMRNKRSALLRMHPEDTNDRLMYTSTSCATRAGIPHRKASQPEWSHNTPDMQVIAEARRLGFYSVRGNHDDKALAAYEAFLADKPVPKKQQWVKEMPLGAAKWLHELPFTIRLPSYGLIVVHAGLVPDVSSWLYMNSDHLPPPDVSS